MVPADAADSVWNPALQPVRAADPHHLSQPAGAGQYGRRLPRAGGLSHRQIRFFRPRRSRTSRTAANHAGDEQQRGNRRLQPMPQRPVLPHARPAPPSAHRAAVALLLRRAGYPRAHQLQPRPLPRFRRSHALQRFDLPHPPPAPAAGADLPRVCPHAGRRQRFRAAGQARTRRPRCRACSTTSCTSACSWAA